jgi:hypothetical protein
LGGGSGGGSAGNAVSTLSSTLGFNTLAFDDEFNAPAGSKPDPLKWGAKTLTGDPKISSASFVGWNQISEDGNGNLKITAARQPNGTWNSGWMESNLGLTPPLLYEVRAKVAPGYGMWSAPAWSWSYPYGTTCGGGEIDNVEQLGRQPTAANQSDHWCGGSLTKTATTPYTLAQDYHIYSAAIYTNHIDYYIDGVLYNTITTTNNSGIWPYIEPTSFNIDLDVGACGSWADCPPPTAPPTADMLIDWFHTYTP